MTDISEVESSDLMRELRRRGYIFAAWSASDVVGIILRQADENDTSPLDDSAIEKAAKNFIIDEGGYIEDDIHTRGDGILEDAWNESGSEYLPAEQENTEE